MGGSREILSWENFSEEIHTHVLFMTLFLVFLIIFAAYIAYLCFRGQLRSPAYIDRSRLMEAKPAAGLDATTINSLPILMHRSSGSGDGTSNVTTTAFRQSECSICLGLFEDKEMVKVMPKCQHAFHCVCVDKWLRNRSTCPVCRNTIVSSSSTQAVTI